MDRAKIVCQRVLTPQNMPCTFFEPAATANTINTDFQIADLLKFGIGNATDNTTSSFVTSWNQHDYYYFIGVSGYTLTLDHMLRLSTSKQQFAAWEDQIQQARSSPYPYALREMGIVGPAGMQGITDTFAAALWTLNFFLYAASLNITHVGMHMTDNGFASAWQPVRVDGHGTYVRPAYYAFAAFDQIIGPGCQARIYAQDVQPSSGDGDLEVYFIYQAEQFAGIVAINSRMFNASGGVRSKLHIDVELPVQSAGHTLYIAYMTNKGADAASGTTWNGLSFEQSGDGSPTNIDDTGKALKIDSAGKVRIDVQDSEAVFGQIDVPVGQLPSNADACSRFGGDTQLFPSDTGDGQKTTTTHNAASVYGLCGRGSVVLVFLNFVWVCVVCHGFPSTM